MAEVFKKLESGSALIYAEHWATIRQNAPGVVELDQNYVSAYSNSLSSGYEGVSGSTKFLVTFNPGLSGGFRYDLSLLAPGLGLEVYAGSSPASTLSAFMLFRIRPITVAYDISAVTWNSFISTPPTMGSPIVYTGVSGLTDVHTTRIDAVGNQMQIGFIPSQTHYGYVIDVAPVADGSPNTFAVATIGNVTTGNWNVPSSGSGEYFMYAVKVQ